MRFLELPWVPSSLCGLSQSLVREESYSETKKNDFLLMLVVSISCIALGVKLPKFSAQLKHVGVRSVGFFIIFYCDEKKKKTLVLTF